MSTDGPGSTRNLYAVDGTTGLQLWTLTGVGGGAASLALTPSALVGSNGIVYMAIGKDVCAFDPALGTRRSTRSSRSRTEGVPRYDRATVRRSSRGIL